MSERDPFGGNEKLRDIITRLWETPERAEWVPKTDTIALSDIREWMASPDIEIVGFAHGMMHDRRFKIEPYIPVQQYVDLEKRYYERCLKENPDGQWSDNRYSAGYTLVNIIGALWQDSQVPRELLLELKNWLGALYREGDEATRTCMVQAVLEHLVEQKPMRQFFSDWQQDSVLKVAYAEACLWPDGGGRTPLGKVPERG